MLPLADSVAHFRLHLVILLFITCCMLLLTQAWRLSCIALAVAILGLAGLYPAITIWDNNSTQIVDGKNIIKVMQVNLYFKNQSLNKVIDLIRKEQPDFIALQEVPYRTKQILAPLKEKYPYQIFCPFSGVGDVVVLSRRPLITEAQKQCAKRHGLVWLRAQINGQEVSFASIHLYWPYPYKQWQQIRKLEPYLKQIPHPVIIAGDFNAAPWSYAVRHIGITSNTKVVGGLRMTWQQPITISGFRFVARLPIDHILASQEFVVQNISKGPDIASDHFPVITAFALK